ncbi:protein AE7 [Selaginella moellendorffii]|uniref:protein AE7 n=1 Tax=Selaginella moellendorffii TaxID=88036 RepID=UPI000D1C8498|nr:protein AE7 [Selaginella moellendorffii]|eukprot:XP_024533753.1 protein AE7 [Selaginella moellendorffii]
MALQNANPVIHERKATRRQRPSIGDESAAEEIDALEVFEHLRDIRDPEHPYSLEQLNVLAEEGIEVDDKQSYVRVTFTPTVQHCSMATLIGLCIRVKLMHSLPPRFKVDIRVAPGSHSTAAAVNKQLNDKERVVAAMENPYLAQTVRDCLAPPEEYE